MSVALVRDKQETEGSSLAKPLLRVLAGERLETPPVWLMRQAGRYLPEYRDARARAGTFLDLCYRPDLATEVTLQPIRRFGFDAAILFSDILVVPDGLGQAVSFREGEGPVLELLRSGADLKQLDLGRVPDHLAPVYDAVAHIRASLPRDVALIGFAGAPWTVATYMLEGGSSRDFLAAKGWLYRDPAAFGTLVDLLVEATATHLIAQIDAGAEVVQLFDTWANALPEDQFRAWVIAPTRAIVSRIRHKHAGVPIIGFPRGAGLLYRDYLTETGVTAVSLDAGVPLAWAATTLQSLAPVQGNLDPGVLVVGGDAMRESVARIRAALGQGPHVFNLGHGIVPATPPEHVTELVALVRGDAN